MLLAILTAQSNQKIEYMPITCWVISESEELTKRKFITYLSDKIDELNKFISDDALITSASLYEISSGELLNIKAIVQKTPLISINTLKNNQKKNYCIPAKEYS